MKTAFKRALIIGGLLIFTIIAFRFLNLSEYLSLESIKRQGVSLKLMVEEHYLWSVVVYLSIYIGLIALALPVVAPLTMLGGFLYGSFIGLFYALIGATIGASISFLLVKYVLRNLIRQHYREQLDRFNARLKSYGYTYLLTLQLMMIFPFFVINTLAALANVPLITFMWTTAVGALPFLLIYAFAGRKLSEVTSMSELFKPHIILLLLLLALLALLPMVIRKLINRWKNK